MTKSLFNCVKQCFLVATCLAFVNLDAKTLELEINSESAILMNAETGAILFEKKPHVLRYPASTTKVATALFALTKASDKLNTLITAEHDAVASISEAAMKKSNYTVPAYWLIPGGTHIGIKKGEELTLETLLYGLLIASGNDAGNVIAQYVGGTIPNFIRELNAYLREIGCKNTTFYNPHGLHHPKHQTTAYDMAIIMKEALKIPKFCEIISTVRYTRPKTNKQEPTVLLQSNKMLRKGKHYYEKTIGGKTGYLSTANHTLVVAAKNGDRTLIAVLLNAEKNNTFVDAINLFEAAFNQPKIQRVILKKGHQKFELALEGASKPIPTYIEKDITLEYYPAEEPKVQCLLAWKSVIPPIKKDQLVGEIVIQSKEGEMIQKIPLLAEEEVSATWKWKLKHPFG